MTEPEFPVTVDRINLDRSLRGLHIRGKRPDFLDMRIKKGDIDEIEDPVYLDKVQRWLFNHIMIVEQGIDPKSPKTAEVLKWCIDRSKIIGSGIPDKKDIDAVKAFMKDRGMEPLKDYQYRRIGS